MQTRPLFFILSILLVSLSQAETDKEARAKLIPAFLNDLVTFENVTVSNQDSPQKLSAMSESINLRYKSLKTLYGNEFMPFETRALIDMKKAELKLETPGAFPNVSQADIRRAQLGHLPEVPLLPIPNPRSAEALGKHFRCFQALHDNGAASKLTMGHDVIVYMQNPEAVYIKTIYHGTGATYIYTPGGVSYITDAEAQQKNCFEHMGGKNYLKVGLPQGEKQNQEIITVDAVTNTFTVAPGTGSGGSCELSATMPTESFNHMNDIAGLVATDLTKAYMEERKDLPRQLVLANNRVPQNPRPNPGNLLAALKTCNTDGVGGAKLAAALDTVQTSLGQPSTALVPGQDQVPQGDFLLPQGAPLRDVEH